MQHRANHDHGKSSCLKYKACHNTFRLIRPHVLERIASPQGQTGRRKGTSLNIICLRIPQKCSSKNICQPSSVWQNNDSKPNKERPKIILPKTTFETSWQRTHEVYPPAWYKPKTRTTCGEAATWSSSYSWQRYGLRSREKSPQGMAPNILWNDDWNDSNPFIFDFNTSIINFSLKGQQMARM